MKVKLKFLNTLPDLARKFRFASDSLDQSDSEDELNPNELGLNDKRIIEQNLVNTENPHIQMRKTISIDYEIYGVTRALLQEFARHPIGNAFVVKSTRYALHRIAKDERIESDSMEYSNEEIVKDYYYIPENDFVEPDERTNWIDNRYDELVQIWFYKTTHKMPNDKLKKYVHDYMYCNITGNISGQALYNMLRQRLDDVAWYQFQDLAKEIYKQIPEEWKPIFKVYKYNKLSHNLNYDEVTKMMKDILNIPGSHSEYSEILNKVYRYLNQSRELLNKNLVEKIDLTEGL